MCEKAASESPSLSPTIFTWYQSLVRGKELKKANQVRGVLVRGPVLEAISGPVLEAEVLRRHLEKGPVFCCATTVLQVGEKLPQKLHCMPVHIDIGSYRIILVAC